MLKTLKLFTRRGLDKATVELVDELVDMCKQLTEALERKNNECNELLDENEALHGEVAEGKAISLAASDVIEMLLLVDPKTERPAIRFHVEEDTDLANALADGLYVLHEALRRADQLPHLVERTLN
ncbi:hypothetical protein ACQKOE_07855 [Novosphingobium sp. NPDC080210]|uniref:hypothetical protein n=1 Tax=Novosphingobium sp. NPDC080210 TaxID=3390596 RepID=UPI003CFC392B